MEQLNDYTDLSERLGIDSYGRLLSRNPISGSHFVVTGAKDYGPNTPYLLSCELLPTEPSPEDFDTSGKKWLLPWLAVLVWLLLPVLLLLLASPAASSPARAYHDTTLPHGRYDWYEADSQDD
jgi:hypothetical protein